MEKNCLDNNRKKKIKIMKRNIQNKNPRTKNLTKVKNSQKQSKTLQKRANHNKNHKKKMPQSQNR